MRGSSGGIGGGVRAGAGAGQSRRARSASRLHNRHMAVHVIYVHGLFMTGIESMLLRQRLARELGAETQTFSYMATLEPFEQVAARLAARMRALHEDTVHLVGHSLGGLVALRAFELLDAAPGSGRPAGRAVLLGSPVGGSTAAARMSGHPLLRQLLGLSHAALLPVTPANVNGRDVGVIAGDHAFGFGQYFAHFSEPNDGTVAVRETALAGAVDRIVLPVSHTGMLLSRRVARETAHFLRYGNFSLRARSYSASSAARGVNESGSSA